MQRKKNNRQQRQSHRIICKICAYISPQQRNNCPCAAAGGAIDVQKIFYGAAYRQNNIQHNYDRRGNMYG